MKSIEGSANVYRAPLIGNKMELYEAIMSRRSVRKFKADDIDNTAIEKILEAGRWAPSWGNSQTWRFVVVRDPKTRAEIAETLYGPKTPSGQSKNPARKAFDVVPVIIVICARMGKAGFHPTTGEADTDKGDWFMFDAALATQNMILTAHDLGLGSVIIGAFDAKRVESLLNIPSGYRVVTLFPLGVPEVVGQPPSRKELKDISFTDQWENK